MLQSMTGFGTESTIWGSSRWIWEIRSLNARYWECQCTLPEGFAQWEMPIRRRLQDMCFRGKVEVRLRCTRHGEQASVWEDRLGPGFWETIKQWSQQYAVPIVVDPLAYWQWSVDGVQHNPPADMQEAIWSAFERALEHVIRSRTQEGRMLRDYLMQRLQTLDHHLQDLQNQLPALQQAETQRLWARYQSWQVEPERTGEALASWSTKTDVAEELSRLAHHIQQAGDYLKPAQPQPVGRPLDFLIQEIQREVHTLSSKLGFTALASHFLQMKIQVDQLREQVQNVA